MTSDSHEPVVYIVDDDPSMLRSLQMVVADAGWTASLHESAEHFLAEYDAARPGCLVLDLKMPGMSGFDLLCELEQRAADLPIIFQTGHGDVTAAVRAMKLGAVDFLEKPVDHHVLVDRIRHAMELDQQRRRQREKQEPVIQALRQLTKREQEVLDLIVDGCGNKEIAAKLHRSIRTVENHRARILRKFDASSSTQLIGMVMSASEAYFA